ncbi:MAG: hypothetical protein H0V66_03400 [Bdellovibrionales bacterium]|nr:hypothetical protein [Bdellovibrionales bacterium]
MKDFFTRPKEELRRVFKNEDTRFMLFTGLKVSSISFFINLIIYSCLFQVMRLNHAFFQSHGFPDMQDDEVFYNYLLSETIDNLTIFFLFHIFLFFIGTYVGWLILRPFRMLGEYCEQVIENPDAIYKVDEFSTYKLLTRFSEFFFEYLRESRKKGMISTNSIPPQFSRIHRPVADKVFMLHFGLLLVIIAISSTVFIIENGTAIFQNMIELATKTLSNSKEAGRFFAAQSFVMDDIVNLSIFLITISYLALGLHLYEKVSGAAFGIFSTMRSFMKGNYFSRVHLVGYGYIRDNTRKLNKYLDYVQNNFEKHKPKG